MQAIESMAGRPLASLSQQIKRSESWNTMPMHIIQGYIMWKAFLLLETGYVCTYVCTYVYPGG